MKFLLSFILVVLAWGCSHHSSVDKHLNYSGNVMDVKELVTKIVIDDSSAEWNDNTLYFRKIPYIIRPAIKREPRICL